jgi:hypothetical protein
MRISASELPFRQRPEGPVEELHRPGHPQRGVLRRLQRQRLGHQLADDHVQEGDQEERHADRQRVRRDPRAVLGHA